MKLICATLERYYPKSIDMFINSELSRKIQMDVVDLIREDIMFIRTGLSLIKDELNWQRDAMHNASNVMYASHLFRDKLSHMHIMVESSLKTSLKIYELVERNSKDVANIYRENSNTFGISELLELMMFFKSEFIAYRNSMPLPSLV